MNTARLLVSSQAISSTSKILGSSKTLATSPLILRRASEPFSTCATQFSAPDGVSKEDIAWGTKKTPLHTFRKPYFDRDNHFLESQLVSNEPYAEFQKWFNLAMECEEIDEPNAVCLSTCSNRNKPSSRMVLLKEFGPEGFKFFSNFYSRKGLDIADNPYASMLFYWAPLMAQVRIEGRVSKLSTGENDEYFNLRPRHSQIAAVVSRQSRPIHSRGVLDSMYSKFLDENEGKELKRPQYWGGYLLKPERFEFWQGQTDRMHDRIQFRRIEPDEDVDPMLTKRGERGWHFERLEP